MGVPLYVVIFILLILIFYLSLIFMLDYYVSWCVPPWVYPAWTWLTISFPMLGKFSAIISSNIFSGPFFLLLLGPYSVNVGAFNVAPEVS